MKSEAEANASAEAAVRPTAAQVTGIAPTQVPAQPTDTVRPQVPPQVPGTVPPQPADTAPAQAPPQPPAQAPHITPPQIARIIADVLGVPDVPSAVVGEHFQDLGGSSLQAIRICARVRKEFGVRAAPEDLFESDTVGDFCTALARATDRA